MQILARSASASVLIDVMRGSWQPQSPVWKGRVNPGVCLISASSGWGKKVRTLHWLMSSRPWAPHYRLTSPSPHSLPCQAWATSNSPLPTQSQPVITRHRATVGWAGTDMSEPLRGKDFCHCVFVCGVCVDLHSCHLSNYSVLSCLFVWYESLSLGCVS